MKVEDISSRATRAALGAALRVHGVPEEDAVVFIETQESERRHLLAATSVGILDVTHTPIPNHPMREWALEVRIIRWSSIDDLNVTSRTVRDEWSGLVTAITVMSPSLGLDATANLGGDSDPDLGLAAFSARASAELARIARVGRAQ